MNDLSFEMPAGRLVRFDGKGIDMRARISPVLIVIAVVTLSLLAGFGPSAAAGQTRTVAAAAPSCPSFSASNFHHSTRINNRYSPLTPGDLYTYTGNLKKQPEVDSVYVDHNTPTIDGINTVEVQDRVSLAGTLTEQTLDWYAQDDQGNVWYMGEYTTELASGDHTGSWTAGVGGAQPGYIMEAAPRVGDNYCQENATGLAQDAAQVVSLTASRTVPYGSFTGNVLQTKEYSLIEPHTEYKYYAPGVGMLEAIALNGGSEDIQLSTIQHNQ